mmetsp:Transcript_144366/g.462502  ORF Transcript_144366/g.462502 Transcript_144366/m.462502 type:complete len:921 (-) Transcript_144366:6-2768(-)
MAPAAGAGVLRDAALEVIAAFLRATGLGGAAGAVEAARAGLGEDEAADGGAIAASLAEQMQSLAGSLERLVAEQGLGIGSGLAVTAKPGVAAEEWVDSLLRRFAQPDARVVLDRGLSARLDQALALAPQFPEGLVRAPGSAAGGVDSLSALCASGAPDEACALSHGAAATAAPGAAAALVYPNTGGNGSAIWQPAPEQAPPPPPPPAGEPSQHYLPKCRGDPDGNADLSIPEEYRDDTDPGYRIREVSESELFATLQERYATALADIGLHAAVAAAASAAEDNFLRQMGLDGGQGAAGEDDDELLGAEGVAKQQRLGGPEEDSVGPTMRARTSTGASDGIAALAASAFGDGTGAHPGTLSPGALGAGNAANGESCGASEEDGASPGDPLSPPSGSRRFSGLMRSAGEKVLAVLGVGSEKDPGSPPLNSKTKATGSGADGDGSGTDSLAVSAAAAEGGGGIDEALPSFGGAPSAAAGRSDRPAAEAAAAPVVATLAAQAALAMQQAAPTSFVYAQPLQPPEVQSMSMPHALAARRKEQRLLERPTLRYADSGDPFYPVELDGAVFDSFFLRVVHERDRTGFEDSKEFPIKTNSIIAARYQVLEYLGSAAFSRAVQCLDLQTNRMVCMKIIKNDKDFLDQSLDEIKLLRLINVNVDNIDSKHCLSLVDYFYHKEHLIIVTELLRDNLYEFSRFNRESGDEPYFTLGRLQRITKQVLTALQYIHSLWLMHADLKPENILIKSYSRCEIKVIDFGSSCFVDDQLTSYIQSRSYRAPEVMLGLPYDQRIDIWSLGCIVAELWTGYVLFQNDSVQSLLARIVGIVGPFPSHMMATGRYVPQYFTQDGQLYREIEPVVEGFVHAPERRLHLLLPKQSSLRQRMRTDDEVFIDFLSYLLQVDPDNRPTSSEALDHPWLKPGRYSDGLQ